MKKIQQLYLVFGGILKKIGEEDFSNIKKEDNCNLSVIVFSLQWSANKTLEKGDLL